MVLLPITRLAFEFADSAPAASKLRERQARYRAAARPPPSRSIAKAPLAAADRSGRRASCPGCNSRAIRGSSSDRKRSRPRRRRLEQTDIAPLLEAEAIS